MHYHYQHVNTLLRSFYHYLMVSFVRQRNNLMVKKTLTTIFLFMHIFYTYKMAITLKIGFFTKNNWHFLL